MVDEKEKREFTKEEILILESEVLPIVEKYGDTLSEVFKNLNKEHHELVISWFDNLGIDIPDRNTIIEELYKDKNEDIDVKTVRKILNNPHLCLNEKDGEYTYDKNHNHPENDVIYRYLIKIDKVLAEFYRDIFYNECTSNPIDCIDDIIKNPDKFNKLKDSYEPINTYPFGEKTNITYSKFIGICRGEECFERFFEEIVLPQIERMKKIGEENSDKTILLIFDKWNQTKFEKYEVDLLNAAFKNNIWTVMLLATNYGIVQIPFLPGYRDPRLIKMLTNKNIIRNIASNELVDLQGDEIVNLSYSGGTWNMENNELLSINTNNLTWVKIVSGNITNSGSINKDQLEKLYNDFSLILKVPNDSLLTSILDAPSYSIEIFGEKIRLSVGSDDKNIKYIQDTIRRYLDLFK